MKYIIFLLLVSGFVACKGDRDSRSGYENRNNTIWNNTEIQMRIKKGNQQVLKLQKGECVSLSDAELDVLTVEEDDYGIWLDDVICSNMDSDEEPCKSGHKALVEAEDGNGWVLVDSSPRNCPSIHGVETAREAAEE